MDTRSQLRDAPLYRTKLCVYCGGLADTKDHSPPRCFLRRPLPSRLLTVPACKKCNCGFSFDENVARALLALTSDEPDLALERQEGGRLDRALARDARLRSVIESARRADGKLQLVGELLGCFERVMRKAAQGVYFGLYGRFLDENAVEVIRIAHQRNTSAEMLIDEIQPADFRDITDEPLPEVKPNSWVAREPVFFLKLRSLAGEEITRLFRLMRESPVEWVDYQAGVFRIAPVKADDGRMALVFDLWKTLAVGAAVPWPGERGPIRRGKKNPHSRERHS